MGSTSSRRSLDRGKLAKLKGKVRARQSTPQLGVILDAYVERVGGHLRVMARSRQLVEHLPIWMERGITATDGEDSLTMTGWEVVQHYYPGVESWELFEAHGEDVEQNAADRAFREAAEDPVIQRVMEELGGVLVDVKPVRKGRKRAKAD